MLLRVTTRKNARHVIQHIRRTLVVISVVADEATLHDIDLLLRFRIDGYDITVFRDARSIIRGTQDPSIARGLYARYIGA